MTKKFIKLFDTGDATGNVAKPSEMLVARSLYQQGHDCADFRWITLENNGGSITVAWPVWQGSICKMDLFTPNPTEEKYLQYYRAGAEPSACRKGTKYSHEKAYSTLSVNLVPADAHRLYEEIIDKHMTIVRTYLQWNRRLDGKTMIPYEDMLETA